MTIIVKNAKKELGLSLQEMKSAQWFIDLPKELQDEAIAQEKASFTPPDQISNTLTNIDLQGRGLWGDWVKLCFEHFPWGDPKNGSAEIKLTKRNFYTARIAE